MINLNATFVQSAGLCQGDKARKIPVLALLGWLFLFSESPVLGQLYQQTFDTPLALTSSASTTTAPYCAGSPNSGQFNMIGSNGAGASYEVPAGTQKLTFNRSGNAAMFTRSTDFSPIPTMACYAFDLAVSNNSVAQTNGAFFQMGFGFSTSTYGSEASAHATLGVNWTSNPGEFSLRNAANSASTALFTGTQTVRWYINNHGSTFTYLGPDGSIQTVANDKQDVWIGNTLAFDETDAADPARSLRGIKFVFNAGQATIELDNIRVTSVPAAPTAAATQTICTSVSPIVGSLTATGTNLKWYTAATGGTLLTSGDPVVDGGIYYVSQTVGGEESSRTAVTVVFSNATISNNSIADNQTMCVGNIPVDLTGSLPVITGGSGTFTYNWEVSSTSAVAGFSTIAGATSQDYTPSATTGNRWYLRRVTSDGCVDYSNVVLVSINPLITNTITANQSVCEGVNPANLGGTPGGGGGAGTYTYVWESSTTDGVSGFSVISGAESATLSPGPLSQTTWFRRIVSSGPCPSVTSNAVQITVTPTIEGNNISSDQTICTGTVPGFISGSVPTGATGNYLYYWETTTTSPGVTGYTAAGITTQEFSPSVALPVTRWYRRRVISGVCTSFSAPVKITVSPVIGSNTISAAQTICSGNAPAPLTGSLPTGGVAPYSYVWESSTTSASTGFTAIPLSDSQGFSPGVLSQTTWFRRVVTAGPCPPSISAAIAITVNQPILGNDVTADQTICANTQPANLTGPAATGGNGTSYAYLWEVATSASGPFSSASATSLNYLPPVLTSNRWYRRMVTSGVCPVSYSDTIQITVVPAIGTNTITTNQTICTGTNPAPFGGSLPTGGTGTYTFEWEISTTSSTLGFATISGETNQTLTYTLPVTQNTWFRRRVNSGVCTSVSSAVMVTINQPVTNNSISGPQIICGGTVPSPLTGTTPAGGTGAFSYLWEVATSSIGPFTSTGSTGITYNVPSLTSTRWYRRRVTAGVCPPSYSDTVEITVVPAIANNSIGVNQTICSGNIPTPISGTAPTGGNGSYTFEWESSTTSASAGFSPIPGSNVQTYAPGPITQDTWFRRKITSDLCSSTSGVIKITINLRVMNNDASASQTICSGTAPATLIGSIPTGGTGTYAYLWEVSSNGTTFSSASITGINYNPPVLSANRWYRRRVISGVCPASYSDTIAVTITPVIANNLVTANQIICEGSLPAPLTGTNPTGGTGAYTFTWQESTLNATSGFSLISGETGQGFSPPVTTDTVWYRRVVQSGVCTSFSTAVRIIFAPAPTVDAGPAMASIVQGATSAPLGGLFGGSATGAVWSAPEGSFNNNAGTTPSTATYTASVISASTVTLTLTTIGSVCPGASATKTITVFPDPLGITGVINAYAEVTGPSTIPVGALSCTVAAGQASQFAKNDRALIIQMKGASVSLPSSPTDVTYGYITGMGNSGNHEFFTVDSVAGDVVFFQRCLKKSYNAWGNVQLVRVPVYTGNYNVKNSSTISSVRLTRRGMGYPPNSVITSGFTITPVNGGVGLSVQARTDAQGQVTEVEILDPGSGYVAPPLITFPDPTVAPFDLPAYKAKAIAMTGLTGMQWNGKRGGIFVMEINGNLNLNDSIRMTGMGFAGGMIGDKGDVAPTCGASAEYALNFATYTRAGQKGEGITNIPLTAMRGKGRYATGGGGGVEPEGGGGGGANWQDGGRGGSSSYIVIANSACSTTVSPCDKDALRGGLGGGTNPTTPVGFKNVLRSTSYYYQPALSRIFLGGGGGGGHAFNDNFGMQPGGAGGFGGGIVIIRTDTLTSNGKEILAKGETGESAAGDGAGGGGAGGAILLMADYHRDGVNGRVNGGNGGSTIPIVCDSDPEGAFPDRKRYFGAGGGGGGGVMWFNQSDVNINALQGPSLLGQSNAGSSQDGFNNTAQKGGSARSQSELLFVENLPYFGSVFTVGGTSPKPTFSDLAKAAEWLAFKGTDSEDVTLLVTSNTAQPSHLSWYAPPPTFRRIFTPGCTYGDAKVTIRPKTSPNSVLLANEVDDLNYITLDGIPELTLKDLTVQGILNYIDTKILVKGGSKLKMDNVNMQGDIKSENTGANDITLINSIHSGSVESGTNQIINMQGTITMNGNTSVVKGLRLGSGSTLNMPSGTILNLNGGSWINNGVANLNVDPASQINFTGSFTTQVIGGTTPTTFDKVNVTGTGQLTINMGPTVRDWNQTGSTLVNTANATVTITEKVKTGTGKFASSGSGKVSLAGPSGPVEVQGTFGNLEMNSTFGADAQAPVSVEKTLILTEGKFRMNNFLMTNEFSSGPSIVNSPTSWVVGSIKQKVQSGKSYFFPVGTTTTLEKSYVNLTSVTGLQYLTCSFKAADPNIDPVVSVVNPFLDGLIYFSNVAPEGYWSINPDAGTATYDVWLYPSFVGMFPTYSIYKRPTASNEWSIFGTLDNTESTPNLVQSDGSVRRSGLTGFSDFALAGGEEPLPLNFLDFRATLRRGGQVKLNWKMAECLRTAQFNIFRGSKSGMVKIGELRFDDADCRSDFESTDVLPTNEHRFYYQVEANSRDEKPVMSPVRVINLSEAEKEKPFLAVVQGESRKYQIMSEDVEETGIRLVSPDGKIIADGLKAENKILDLHSIPKGVYLVEMVNSGWTVRQRIVVGF